MIIKHYTMQARAAEGPALRSALDALADHVCRIDGVVGLLVCRDAADPDRFVFIERWASADHYDRGSGQIDKALFKPVMAVLTAAPVVQALVAVRAEGHDAAA